MLFMVIERFRDNDMAPVYRRLAERGRGLPEGLRFVDSWVEAGFGRCFQLMDCDDALSRGPACPKDPWNRWVMRRAGAAGPRTARTP
jgi:hypothetical protein